jgi:hypothetical protein
VEPGVEVRAGAKIRGLSVAGGRVVGVRLDGGLLPADWVVDAHGRRPALAAWHAGSAASVAQPESSDCGVTYYSRYYQQRRGFQLPDGPWFLSPRGDLGYMAFASFPGDNRTLAATLAVPSGVPQWRFLARVAQRHVDPDEPGEDRDKHPGHLLSTDDALGQRWGLAAAVPDQLNVSGEQLLQAVDVPFPEGVEEPLGEFLALASVRLDRGRPS